MKPVDKYNKWIKEHPDKLKGIFDLAVEKYGYDRESFKLHLANLRGWLIKNEGNKKAEKKMWGTFIKKNLKTKEVRDWYGRNKFNRNKPSDFIGVTGEQDLSEL